MLQGYFAKAILTDRLMSIAIISELGERKRREGEKKMGNLGFSASTMTLICV